MKRTPLLILVLGVGVLLFAAPASIGADSTAEPFDERVIPAEESVVAGEESAEPLAVQDEPPWEEDIDEVEYEEFSDELDELASVSFDELSSDETVDDNDEPAETGPTADDEGAVTGLTAEQREAAEEGALEGIELAQEQGVNVTQAQEQAAIESALRSASETEDASPEKITAATKGATHGAIIQSQQVNVTQLQAGIYGSSVGALSQFQDASVTQLQSAAYGAAHGTVAQHQRVNVTQIQYAAVGAAAGATHSAVQTQQVNVTQIQEAAQGGGYGSLVQVQEVSVTQIQAAAFGAAGGGADTADGPKKDPKKVQEATMGAAQGALVQVQGVSGTQIQAAARGASTGALLQYQHASVTQIHHAAKGAAEGAISQHQVASVVQIQAAAMGSVRGTLLQVQRVDVVQIQYAAAGAARGAAKSAAQHQVVDVQQIQAAAAGAGQGSVIQIQQVNVRQVQVIAEGAASGALSQYQHASVVQIQQAARGASDGALSITQIQVVTITQIQIISERTAAETARTAADTDIDHDEKIYKHAKGDAEDPERDEEPDLKSLFFDVEDETLFLANPNDVTVTVTATSDGTVETITLSPGEMLTRQLEPGSYTLTAESADGRTVKLTGRESIRIAISEEPESLTANLDDQVLRLTNPNDQHATVTVHDEQGRHVLTVDVSPTGDRRYQLDPGTYTLTAVLADGRPVQVNDEDEAAITVVPEELHLGVTVEDGTVTVQNPSETDVTVTAIHDETGDEREIAVAGGATESLTLEPGPYTLTGAAEDGRTVLLNGETELSITLTESQPEAVALTATVGNETLSLENPAETDVTVIATDESDEQRTFEVEAAGNTTEELEPGSYTLTGEAADDRPVTLNGEAELSITVEESTVETQIESCRVIDEPGEYELAGDLVPEEDETCLEITVGDVTIDGNDYEIDGSIVPGQPESNGIEVSRVDDDVAASTGEEDAITDVRIHDVQVTSWSDGVHVDEHESATIEDARIEDNQRGIFIANEGTATVSAVTLEANEEIGLYATLRGDVTITDSVIQENGHGMTTHEDSVLEMDSSVVRNNDGDGMFVPETEASITDTTITGNDGVGLGHWMTLTLDLDNVTVSDNSDWELGPTTFLGAPSSTFAVTDLHVGETATLSFDVSSTLALDVEDQETMPDSESARTVGDGLNATNLDGSADLQLEYDADQIAEDEAVELWQYDGTEWLPVQDATVTEDALVATIEEDGVYAPVVPTAEPLDTQIDSCREIDEPGEYELTSDLVSDEGEDCLEVTAENVTIDGNGYTVEGPGPDQTGGAGLVVDVASIDDPEVDEQPEEIQVRDITITGWNYGLLVENHEQVSVEDSVVRENAFGIDLGAYAATAVVSNVDVEANEQIGIYSQLDGLRADLTVTESTIQDNGDGIQIEEDVLTLESSTVQNNDGVGVSIPESMGAITDTTITDNAGTGIVYGLSVEFVLDNVTVSSNDGPELGPVSPGVASTLDATDLRVGAVATLDFSIDAAVALDTIDQGSLPLPDEVRAVGAGLDVTDLDGTAELRLEFEPDEIDDETVELWWYDGIEWQPVEDGAVTEDALEASISDSGLYAPVVSEDLTDVDLEVTVVEQTVTIENPAATEVTVTATADPTGEVVQTIQIPPEGAISEEFDAGSYTLAGEADDRQVTLNGEAELGITIEGQDIDLAVTAEEDAVTLTNPSETAVTVTASNDETGQEKIIDVPADGTVTEELEAGTYTLTGEAADDRPVTLDGEAEFSLTIEEVQETDLDVTVGEETVTITNPSEVLVTVTATNDETGEEQIIDVPAEGTVTATLEAGTYTLTGQAVDERPVTLNGETAFTVTIEGVQEIDLGLTVEEDTVTLTNPSETAVTVTASNDETGEVVIIDVPASGVVTETLDPGSYTLTGEAEGQDVLLNGQESVSLTVDSPDTEFEQ